MINVNAVARAKLCTGSGAQLAVTHLRVSEEMSAVSPKDECWLMRARICGISFGSFGFFFRVTTAVLKTRERVAHGRACAWMVGQISLKR